MIAPPLFVGAMNAMEIEPLPATTLVMTGEEGGVIIPKLKHAEVPINSFEPTTNKPFDELLSKRLSVFLLALENCTTVFCASTFKAKKQKRLLVPQQSFVQLFSLFFLY